VISKVAKVYLPVEDQSDALAFWTDRMGFETVQDASFGDERWIEVKPPGQELLLVLTRRGPDDGPRRDAPERLPHSNVMFDCDDIEATYAELTARGVVFSLPPERQHFGWWSLFEDPDGTRYALGQWG
jgi:predicted enzyme related to lactoylglutathione lyase